MLMRAQKAERERDEARAAFAIATDQCVVAQGELRQWRECTERLAAVLRDADVIAENDREDGRREWCGDIGWLGHLQTAIVIDCPPDDALAEFERLKEASK